MTSAAAGEDTRFVAYEYTAIPAKAEQESLIKDAYRSFGWACESVDRSSLPAGAVTLRLKRDRAVPNKIALAKLQRQLENALEAIANLERSKTAKASITALSVGLLGSAALAGSVFCFLSGIWPPFTVLGVVGLVGWALPYFLYTNIRVKHTAAANAEIDRQYDQFYATCEQAAALAKA
ncbi:MAG: hypothetical protein LBI84_04150 [Propionibacteriaceae bacterium]|jgi:Flp pilus assembly protein TadB|nr:hypothetical protein [Propionibacteriaceae bacterium]